MAEWRADMRSMGEAPKEVQVLAATVGFCFDVVQWDDWHKGWVNEDGAPCDCVGWWELPPHPEKEG